MASNEDLQLGRQAMARNLVTREELAAALKEQERRRAPDGSGPKLGEVLVSMGLLTENQIAQLQNEQSAAPAAAASGSQRLGGYELLAKLGSGGMGTVYKARQTSLNRIVALKVLPQRLAKDRDFLARFYREARSVAKLNHPNIVAGIDVGEADGYHYLAMEFVSGRSAAAMLAEGPAGLPYKQVLDIAIQTARAMEHAHDSGVIHRDIKPENILVDDSGKVKICDLGLARSTRDDASLTQAGIAVGTPHYISPEQARGEHELDPRTDVYSLGASVFHLASGQHLFSGDNAMQIMLKHINDAPAPLSEKAPSVPPDFSAVVAKCLAKRREDRYSSMKALLEDLELVAAGQKPAHAAPPAPGTSAAPVRRQPTGRVHTAVVKAVAARRRRNTRLLIALVATGALALVVYAVAFMGRTPESERANTPVANNNPNPNPEPAPAPDNGANRAKELFDEACQYAEKNPASYRSQMALFRKAQEVGDPESVWSRLAARRAQNAEDDLRRAVDQALAPLRIEAETKCSRREYAAALEGLSRLPKELEGEPLATAAANAIADKVRAAGEAEWRKILEEARKLGDSERFPDARSKMETARAFGLPTVSAAMDRELAALADAEKKAVARERKAAEDRCEAFRKEFPELLKARKYADAAAKAEGLNKTLPADLRGVIAAALADLKVVQGVWQQARDRLKSAKAGEYFTIAGFTGRFELPTDWAGRPVNDGERFLLRRKVSSSGEEAPEFRFSKLATEDVLALAGLADGGKTASDAERALYFRVFDSEPKPDVLERALGTARMRGVDTARFDALLHGAQGDARDRRADEELRGLEELVKAGRWDDVIRGIARLGETYADCPAYQARAEQIQAWQRQAQQQVAARERAELILQDGQPVPELGISCYNGARDTTLSNSSEGAWGRSPLLRLSAGATGERALLRFDLPALPPGATVESARLELFRGPSDRKGDGLELRAYRVTSDWREGSKPPGTKGDTDGATWLQRGRDVEGVAAPWTTPGGDRDNLPDRGKGPGVIDAVAAPAPGQWVQLDVTVAIQDFLAGRTRPLFGFLVTCEGKADAADAGLSFPSREAVLQYTDKRPRLVLTLGGLKGLPAPPQGAAIPENQYHCTRPADVAAFKTAVRIFKGTKPLQPATPPYGEEGASFYANPHPWVLETRRTWGQELEVAARVSLPGWASIGVDLGDRLPDCGAQRGVIYHTGEGRDVIAGFGSGSGPGSTWQSIVGAGGVRCRLPKAAFDALFGGDRGSDVRFIKQGARLRVECGGVVFAELTLSPREEQLLATKPVRIFLNNPTGSSGDRPPIRLLGLRMGPVRKRPEPPELPADIAEGGE